MASFDGFYLTWGHYLNNSSATLHDHSTGKIAYFSHRTKKGPGHNWSGTSGGAEADILDELLGKAKEDGLVVQEVVTDRDSSINATFCRHFLEGKVTYFSNHCAKTLHIDLEKIKRPSVRCVNLLYVNMYMNITVFIFYSVRQPISDVSGYQRDCLPIARLLLAT